MEKVVIGNAELYLGDCLEGMRDMEDKAFDLAIVDPPYGINAHIEQGLGDGRNGSRSQSKWVGGAWDKEIPSKQYFEELFRVSKNQVIWGGNYFDLPPTSGIVCWDKVQRIDQSDFELAWTSFSRAARIFTFARSNLQGFRNPNRFHPTEKPVQLYKWILKNYAMAGNTILDTHHGSGSNAIACLDMGFKITAYEIDEDYFRASCLRIEQAQQQLKLAL